MRVFCQGNVFGRVVEQPRKAPPDLVGLLEREIPHIIDVLGRVEPRLLLRFECDIGPRLMGMTGEENALGNAERL